MSFWLCFWLEFRLLTIYFGYRPRWLAGRGRHDEARMALARIRGLKHSPDASIVDEDFDEIMDRVKMEEGHGVGTWAECFVGVKGIPKLVYRTWMLMILQSLQQLTGEPFSNCEDRTDNPYL